MKEKKLAFDKIKNGLPECSRMINSFSAEVLKTRGGRIGSGMGSLLEALWGYNINQILARDRQCSCEIAWFPDHQYHDFACVERDNLWDPIQKTGELFRVEAKSMNSDADESKAHFSVLQSELEEYDALLLIIWNWTKIDAYHICPMVTDIFFDAAKPIAILRDELHAARGGSFVDKEHCPDGCSPLTCKHHGEPLNEQNKRERISGPDTTRPSAKVSFAANFGGLIRMLKTRGTHAKNVFRMLRKDNETIHSYINFIHTNFPSEEINHYSMREWQQLATKFNINPNNKGKQELQNEIRKTANYQELLRNINF